MRKLFGSVMGCLGLALAGCQDPGCIRNSECKSGFECKASKCTAPDAGAADGGMQQASASGKGGASGGKAGASGGKAGASSSAGASAGQSGQAGQGGQTTATPDAGTP